MSTLPATSRDLFNALSKIINLPLNVIRLQLTLAIDELATLELTYHPTNATTTISDTEHRSTLAADPVTEKFDIVKAL